MSSSAVSVIIPCYNQGRFLGEALDSVVAQTRPADQIVVVDDGSSDETAEVAQRYSGITYVRQANLGLALARNRGLDEATGRYVVFLDADDRLRPDALKTGLDASRRHPNCAFVFGRCERMDERGDPLPTRQPPVIDGNHYAALLQSNYIWTPAVAVFDRANCRGLLRFDPAVDPAADYDLYLRIARDRCIKGHGHVVADYRLHRGSMSQNAALMLEATVAVLYMQRPFATKRPDHEAAWTSGLRAWRAHYGDAIVDAMRVDARHPRRWGAFTGSLGTLLRYAPRDAWRHARRKIQLIVLGATPPGGDSEPSEPTSRHTPRKSVG
jgi:glycosyltransferase involved in cell wall biosynthesis